MDKLVSVVVPCFNQEEYLEETVQSVLNQSYQHWECLIINDGSSDNSLTIARDLALKNNRISVINQNNAGLSSSRNKGISNANGELILPLDADDRISENYIAVCVNHFLTDTSLSLVYGSGIKFGHVNENWDLPRYSYNNLLFGNMIFCTAMFKKTDWEKVNGYDAKMIYGYEDWEFWVNMLNTQSKVLQDSTISFFYRIKEKSMFSNMTAHQISLMRQYVYKKHSEKYNSYFIDPISVFQNRNDIQKEYDNLLNHPLYYLKKYLKNL